MATYVLVHGAWHGAWCFDPVLARLDAAGVAALAVDLPGHGADAGPLSDLHGDAAHVRKLLDTLDGEVILLGHSYGGAVITEAGTHPSVSHLVYLCAFPLDEGESCMTCAITESARAGLTLEGPSLADAMVTGPGDVITVTTDGAVRCFFHDCDPVAAALAVSRLGPQPAGTLADIPAAVAWRDKPSTYVVCGDDRAVDPRLQRMVARRCTTTVEWPTSHSPFLSRPDLVADLLVSLAG
jgi:pimeloyl-ACP methyl ester carboxylesterase